MGKWIGLLLFSGLLVVAWRIGASFRELTAGETWEEVRQVNSTSIKGVVVPHHLLAEELIVRGLRAGCAKKPERIVLMVPNHIERGGYDFVTGRGAWHRQEPAILADDGWVDTLVDKGLLVEQNEILIEEHAVAGVAPVIVRECPGALITPLVVSNRLGLEALEMMRERLGEYLRTNDALLVASIDFSHYLLPEESRKKDRETLEAIRRHDYARIISFENDHVDTRAGLAFFLEVMSDLGRGKMTLLENTNSAELTGKFGQETTSYVVGVF